MAYRGHRRYRRSSYRRKPYTDWAEYNRQERAAVAKRYGGVDDDIRHIFFSLDEPTLTRVFADYRHEYGKGKLGYARSTYKKWKSGEVNMSGEVSERLLDILPGYLDFSVKYILIEKMWRNRNKRSLRVSVAPSEGLTAAVQRILDVIDSLDIDVLPESLKSRISWLAEADATVGEQLLLRLYTEERKAVIGTLKHELHRVGNLVAQARKSHVKSTHRFDMPGAVINVVFEEQPRTFSLGSFLMGNEDTPKKDEAQQSRELVPREPESPSDLAPIKDAETLLNKALEHVSPEKKQEIIDKAADEALRLQAKRAHNELEREMADKMLDTAGRVARQVEATPNANIKYDDQIDKEHGSTRVEVRSQEGFCFVATACYGDYEHPTVRVLRHFRDRQLLTTRLGSLFVSLYYRYGRVLAVIVDGIPLLKPIIRGCLATFARFYRGYSQQR